MRSLVRPLLPTLLLVLAATACAATRTGATGHDQDRISREEIVESDALNAYELVQRLRPRWLSDRGGRSLTMGTQILVYLDGARLGNTDMLRQVSREGIYSMRYLDASQATAELSGIGSEHVAGAIVISTRPGR